mgnify:FL=1
MRYCMTTRDALHRTFFEDSKPNAVSKVTSRLEDAGFLKSYDFEGARRSGAPRKYFVLGLEGVCAFGVNSRRSKPIGKQAIVDDYGALAYCCLGKKPRERLTVSELQRYDSGLVKGKLATGPYYRELTAKSDSLVFIRVDYGSTIDNLMRKCEDDIRKRMEVPAFRQLITDGQFQIAIATTDRLNGQRADRIREAILRRSWPIRFQVEGVTGLFELW